MEDKIKADLEVVADLAERANEPKQLPNGRIGIVIPDGATMDVLEADAGALHPGRKKGTVRPATVDALIAYVTRHQTPGTEVYVHPTNGRVEAVLNDHADDTPGWGDHRARLDLRTTPEWDEWVGSDGRRMGQDAFAEFIEENGAEIVEPDAATMLEIATTFTATTGASFNQSTRLDNGNVSFAYTEETTGRAGANGRLEVPTEFKLAVAPFVGEAKYAITARLRWRLSSGNLSLSYKLDRPDAVVRDCLAGVAARIAETFENTYVGEAR